jgi:transmembrane sensor
MEREDIKKTLEKFANQTISVAEKARFMGWLDEVKDSEFKEILDLYSKIIIDQKVNRKPNLELLENIKKAIEEGERQKVSSNYKLWPYNFAASIGSAALLVLIVVAFFINWRPEGKAELITSLPELKKNGLVSLSDDKASLTLVDGSKIILDDIEDGQFINQDGIKIYKSKGLLTYVVESPRIPVKSTARNHTISVPKGRQYRVNLPDGSKVWLNNATALSFPIAIPNNDRIVELIGEAYFEVTKMNNKPFSVVSNNQIIKVLGTHFNVNSYADEELVKTTVLEGSVQVVSINSTSKREIKKVLLKPGQQSQVTPIDGNLKISKAGNEVTAWKAGYFDFNHEDIKGIMRKIARWYDLEVQYEGKISEEKFVGSISCLENVSDVLKALEIAGDVHFKIKGRRIVVMP